MAVSTRDVVILLELIKQFLLWKMFVLVFSGGWHGLLHSQWWDGTVAELAVPTKIGRTAQWQLAVPVNQWWDGTVAAVPVNQWWDGTVARSSTHKDGRDAFTGLQMWNSIQGMLEKTWTNPGPAPQAITQVFSHHKRYNLCLELRNSAFHKVGLV